MQPSQMSWQSLQPSWGLVLGSGLGSFVEQMQIVAEVPYAEIEGLAQSKVTGHAGRFVFGEIGGVLAVAAQGRVKHRPRQPPPPTRQVMDSGRRCKPA